MSQVKLKKVALVMPFSDRYTNWSSYPSINLLASFLKKKELDSDTFDLNLIIIEYMLSTSFLKKKMRESELKIKSFNRKKRLSKHLLNEYFSLICYTKILKFLLKEKNRLNSFFKISNEFFYKRLIEDFDISREYNEILNNSQILDKLKEKAGLELKKVFKQIINKQKFSQYSFFGISIPSGVQFPYALVLAKTIKEIFPKTHICFGGSFITISKGSDLNFWIKKKYFDTYIKFSGEEKIHSLIKDHYSNKRLNGEYKPSEQDNLDINEQELIFPNHPKTVGLLLSRGCFWGKCAFCDYTKTNYSFRIKKVPVLIKEIINLKNKYKIKKFLLVSDSLPPLYAKKLSLALIKNKLKICWSCTYMRVNKLYDDNLFRLMKKSGFDFSLTTVGIDSLCEKSLRLVNKGYNKNIIRSFFESARSAKIRFKQINIIFDLPGSSLSENQEGIKMLAEYLDILDSLTIFSFQLTSSSNMGLSPEKYGLKVNKRRKKGDDFFYCNSVDYNEKKCMTNQQKDEVRRLYDLIRLKLSIFKNYSKLDRNMFSSIKMYDSNKLELLVKLPKSNYYLESFFDSQGNKLKNQKRIKMHKKYFFPENFLIYYRYIEKMENGKWHSLDKINNLLEHTSTIEKYSSLQELFSFVKYLMTQKYFEDVKLKIPKIKLKNKT